MEIEIQNINGLWLELLKKFFGDNLIIVDPGTDKKQSSFKIEKVLNTSINISNRWGFLTLEFSSAAEKITFLNYAGIDFTTKKEQINNWVRVTHNKKFLKDNFPCRVFPESNSKAITFYDLEKCEKDQLLNNRLIVFESVMIGVLKQKIKGINY